MMPGMQGSLAERLRVLRARKGLTLVEASKAIGIDRHTLRDLERGKRAAYFPTIEKIAKGYGVAVSTLVAEGGEDSETAGVKQEPALSGKAEAPPATPPSSSAASKTSEAGQQSVESQVVNALASYIQKRARVYKEDLDDPNSFHFAYPAATALWGSALTQENLMLSGLVQEVTEALVGPLQDEVWDPEAMTLLDPIRQSMEAWMEVCRRAMSRFAAVGEGTEQQWPELSDMTTQRQWIDSLFEEADLQAARGDRDE